MWRWYGRVSGVGLYIWAAICNLGWMTTKSSIHFVEYYFVKFNSINNDKIHFHLGLSSSIYLLCIILYFNKKVVIINLVQNPSIHLMCLILVTTFIFKPYINHCHEFWKFVL